MGTQRQHTTTLLSPFQALRGEQKADVLVQMVGCATPAPGQVKRPLRRLSALRSASSWKVEFREDEDIRDEVKRHGRLTQLAVSDCLFDKSGSDITHTEYLHLRTIWYRYNGTHIESFTRLFRDDKETGYKGFISHTADEWASRLMSQKLAPLDQYLHEFQRRQGDPEYLHPSPASGYFAMVRYWQVMAITHTKGDNEGRSKIFKPRIGSGPLVGTSSARPVTPPQQQEPQGADLPSQPSTSGIPPISATPAARSYPAARGTAENRPSADEAYVNTALLLLLQAVTQLFHKNFEPLHWVPPRMALHLKVPTANQDTKRYDESVLLEARMDGYLCNGALEGGLSRPLAICEAKSAVKSSIQVPTERQEAAEMAAWICNSQSHVGLLQASASGRKRRLMISQTRDEIWIIIGEYGQAYEEYIPSNFEETLGSPAFLDQIEKMGVEGNIIGWNDPAVKAALSERSRRQKAESSLVSNQSTRGGRAGGTPETQASSESQRSSSTGTSGTLTARSATKTGQPANSGRTTRAQPGATQHASQLGAGHSTTGADGGSGKTLRPPASNQSQRSSSTSPSRGSRGSANAPAGEEKKQPPQASGGDQPRVTTRTSGISGALAIRSATKSDQPEDSGPVTRAKARATQQASVGDNPKKPVQTPDLPKIDGFLVMHRFGPWKTFDKENMQVFVRRLLGLMIELHINESSHSHSASSGSSK
ncbi:uncharacterized protein P884DRAFT_270565 [Thermothelomyces heterothallicus CBS 202.75]|uniref:uncharacterized protein n=1 Tax=Thermothelomyces heterothallicus CBS 202.75 TaxID=1149848 RepID=UPI0037421FE6